MRAVRSHMHRPAPDTADCPASTRCYGIDSTNPFNEPDIFVYRSADGGASWQQAGPNWARSVLNDIACPAALTCYLAGTHGTIARITNGTTLPRSAPRLPATYTASAAPSPCHLLRRGRQRHHPRPPLIR